MKTRLLILFIPFLLNSFTSVSLKMASASMEPTIPQGELMKIEKVDAVNRQDIVVFEYKHPTMEETNWVFRVAGLPGDTVEIRSGILYLNGKKIDESYVKFIEDVKGPELSQPEVLGSTVQNSWNSDNYGPLVLPKKGEKFEDIQNVIAERYEALAIKNGAVEEDLYFLLGDSRHNAYDSRYIGLVPASAIVGKVVKN